VEYKRLAGAYPLCNCHKICRVCTPFRIALDVNISLDLLKGLWSYGGFKLMVSGYPKFSAHRSGETVRQTRKVFEAQECAQGPLLQCQVWWARISVTAGATKFLPRDTAMLKLRSWES